MSEKYAPEVGDFKKNESMEDNFPPPVPKSWRSNRHGYPVHYPDDGAFCRFAV